jgi:hypothetical protein
MVGRTVFSAVPSVWGCLVARSNGTRAWTTLRWPADLDSSGIMLEAVWLADVGRYILIGTCLSSSPGGLRSLDWMELKSGRSSGSMVSGPDRHNHMGQTIGQYDRRTALHSQPKIIRVLFTHPHHRPGRSIPYEIRLFHRIHKRIPHGPPLIIQLDQLLAREIGIMYGQLPRHRRCTRLMLHRRHTCSHSLPLFPPPLEIDGIRAGEEVIEQTERVMPLERHILEAQPCVVRGDVGVDQRRAKEGVQSRQQEGEVRQARVLDQVRVRVSVGAAVGRGEPDLEGQRSAPYLGLEGGEAG